MPLGACRLKKHLLALAIALGASLCLISCNKGPSIKKPPSGSLTRVVASQGVTATTAFGGLVLINGWLDTLLRARELSAGIEPGLMAMSPDRSQLVAFDAGTNNVYAISTATETAIGQVQLPGPTYSMAVPTASPFGYAAVPTASVNGFSFVGAVEVMNLLGAITTSIAVTNAQTIVSNVGGTELLVFSNDSDVMTVLYPSNAVPPVDTSCLPGSQNSSVCVSITGFSRPVYAVINGSTAYVLNCGLQCGGTQPASVAVFDMNGLAITSTIPVDAATWAFLSNSTLYVAGTSPTNNACTGQTTQATTCGRLDVIDLNSGTVTANYVITDGYHQRMDMSSNGQLFVGSVDCTNIGDVNNPSGEVRGCLSILNTTNNTVVIPPDNGDVNGLQSFSTRYVEYVAEGGNLRVYDTTIDALLINDYILTGTIPVVGYVGDVKAIDFF
jgi:hypothetical protein